MAYRRFDDDTVRKIRAEYEPTKNWSTAKPGKITIRSLMAKYGGSYQTIWNIVNYMQYKDVQDVDSKDIGTTDSSLGSNPTNI